jgi:hypothetical protein
VHEREVAPFIAGIHNQRQGVTVSTVALVPKQLSAEPAPPEDTENSHNFAANENSIYE